MKRMGAKENSTNESTAIFTFFLVVHLDTPAARSWMSKATRHWLKPSQEMSPSKLRLRSGRRVTTSTTSRLHRKPDGPSRG